MMTGYEHDHVVPYQGSSQSKKEQVAGMFNGISHRYDFLNRFLSGGLDIIWRKKALQQLKGLESGKLLDVATGTADVAIMASGMYPNCKITGIDISEGMLDIGRKKLSQKKLDDRITLMTADSEQLPFEAD